MTNYSNRNSSSGEYQVHPDGRITLKPTATPHPAPPRPVQPRPTSSVSRPVSRPRQTRTSVNRSSSRMVMSGMPAFPVIPVVPVIPVIPVVYPAVYNVCSANIRLAGAPNECVNGSCNRIVGDNYGRICGVNNVLEGNNYGVVEGTGNVITGNNNGTVNGISNVINGKNYGFIYGLNNVVYNR